MVIEESGLKFEFSADCRSIKFDDTEFYRQQYNKLPSAKGVDIISDRNDRILFIEVKNCTGHESENMWRTSVDNSKVSSAPQGLRVEDRDSLDIEVAKKVASTITCLYGAWTKAERTPKAMRLSEFWQGMETIKIPKDKKRIEIILFLEGEFGVNAPVSRTKRMIMKSIRDSISKKLDWLNCIVSVVDSNTYNPNLFTIK